MQTLPTPHQQAGFSYLELLIATTLIIISLIPAIDALHQGVLGSQLQAHLAIDQYAVLSKTEQVLAEPFSALNTAAAAAGNATTPTSYSDTIVTADGRSITRQVYLAAYDGDNADADNDPFSGTDSGLLWVRVQIAGTATYFETLTAQ